MSVKATYDEFEAASREARRIVESSPGFVECPDSHDLAYRSLAELQAMATTWALGTPTADPRIQEQMYWHSGAWTFGAPCQDFRYGNLLLDGRGTYRLRGRIGRHKLTFVQVHSQSYGHPLNEEFGQYDVADLAASDGHFDIAVGAGLESGAGIALSESSRMNVLFIRRVLAEADDDPGSIWVETVVAPPRDADDVSERLLRAADMVRYLAKGWAVGLQDLYLATAGGELNRVAYQPGEDIAGLAGSPFACPGRRAWPRTSPSPSPSSATSARSRSPAMWPT